MADDGISNPTDNRPFEDILDARIARRTVLGGTLATAALTFFSAGPALAEGKPGGNPGRGPADARPVAGAPLDFEAVPLSDLNTVVVPAGYVATSFLPWGTPILPGAGSGPFPANAAEQEKRIGLGHDGMWFFPTRRDGTRGVLCINMEFGTNPHIANGTGMAPGTADFVALSQAAHGVAVVEIEKTVDGWHVVMGSKNRRITPNTPVEFSGPVAGSPMLENRAGNEPKGTVNNCANGRTPWGTYLTCEENFNGYFGVKGIQNPDNFKVRDEDGKLVDTSQSLAEQAKVDAFNAARSEEWARYGLTAFGFEYEWDEHDARFDLANADYANEPNRFGWVVEIDPMKPGAKPVKRTALGRMKHENCEIVEGRGKRIVAYMGDDERFDYVYKFVSESNWKSMRARGMSPLDHGTLHVARFHDDGTGEWLPLTMDDPVLAARFTGMDDLLINARIAGDILEATPMDRPEWAAANPVTGEVFITMTNNSRRTEPNAPNPRFPNPWGHILKIVDADQHVGTTFEWDIFVLSGPAGAGSTTTPEGEHGSPDGLAFDRAGRMYIQTDGSQPKADGSDRSRSNDQMLIADPSSGEIRRFLTGVQDCEVTGWTPLDGSAFMVNLQHPGNGNPSVTSWPAPDDETTVPRDACVVVTKVG